jgi:hypothetical protein
MITSGGMRWAGEFRTFEAMSCASYACAEEVPGVKLASFWD